MSNTHYDWSYRTVTRWSSGRGPTSSGRGPASSRRGSTSSRRVSTSSPPHPRDYHARARHRVADSDDGGGGCGEEEEQEEEQEEQEQEEQDEEEEDEEEQEEGEESLREDLFASNDLFKEGVIVGSRASMLARSASPRRGRDSGRAERPRSRSADTRGTRNSSSLSPAPTSPAPTPTSTRPPAAAASTSAPPSPSTVTKLLRRYLAEMRKTHAYIVASALTAARLDALSRPPPPLEKVLFDATSPFAAMRALETTPAASRERGVETGRFAVKFHGKAVENRVLIPATPSVTPKGLAMMPKYHSYTTLRNNILAEDDEVMRYFPYFGEDAEEEEISQLNLEETFVDRTKASAEEGRRSEYAAMYATFLPALLADLRLTPGALISYLLTPCADAGPDACRRDALPDDFDPEDARVAPALAAANTPVVVGERERERAEPLCTVWKRETGFSVWEVVKRAELAKEAPVVVVGRKGGGGEEGVVNMAQFSLESYAALNCLLCFMHECPFHVNKDHDRISMAEEGTTTTTATTTTTTAAPHLHPHPHPHPPPTSSSGSTANGAVSITAGKKDNSIILKLATNVPGWSSMSQGAAKDAWERADEACSKGCFLSSSRSAEVEVEVEEVEVEEWTVEQAALLRSSAGVLRNNERCACLLASIIDRTCAEIHRQLVAENLLPTPSASRPAPSTATDEPSKTLKRKKPTTSAIPGYPADCNSTHAHDKRAAFQACRHLGHCTDTCPCVRSHVTCEKSCICAPTCPRRWRGCSCKKEGKPCMKDSCVCVKANRECDVDLCHSCGAVEALDPAARDKERLDSAGCQNVWLQRDTPKRTLLGRSAVAGFGLFMGEPVKSGSFLGEYKGEVITSDEADRRGKLYDKRGVSFLFNLNLNQVIDATRAGNKFRYVNHSTKRPNCGAKVLMAGCTHRIGMFAKRDLKAGEELFFDYGYNNKQVKFVQKEFEPPEASSGGGSGGGGGGGGSAASAAGGAGAGGAGAGAVGGTVVAVRRNKATGAATARRKELSYLRGGKGTTERSRAKAEAAAGGGGGGSAGTGAQGAPPQGGGKRRVKSAEFVQDSEEEEEGDEEYEPESEDSGTVGTAAGGALGGALGAGLGGARGDRGIYDIESEEETEEEIPRIKKRVRAR